MPRRQELPEALAGLARRNALSLRHESFRADADRLLTAIEPILRRPASQAQISTGPARPTTPPVKATEPETARTAEITIPASVRPDTGWSTSQVRTFEHPSKWTLAGPKQVLDVVFSSDGRWLATASDDHTARIWDVATGQPLQTLSHNKEVQGWRSVLMVAGWPPPVGTRLRGSGMWPAVSRSVASATTAWWRRWCSVLMVAGWPLPASTILRGSGMWPAVAAP